MASAAAEAPTIVRRNELISGETQLAATAHLGKEPRWAMSKGRFLNQKLGKRSSRRVALRKSQLAVPRPGARDAAAAVHIPKKGNSREGRF